MSWSTVYIKGKSGFEEVVLTKLQNKWLNGTAESGHKMIMFWLSDHSRLRDFKMAIGSRIIFKYRLLFYTDLDEYIQAESRYDADFTQSEMAMIDQMTPRNLPFKTELVTGD